MSSSIEAPKRIRPLDPQLVNRIAAGEIIQRPCNALKELIENSLDAGSTSINIQIKEGGLKLLHITDNGCGIARDDLGIICERYTTSKLEKFEDLTSINTFGFRGEALASISHVSRLTIMTKTRASQCGFKASYLDGRLDPSKPIQPCAMSSHGTQIIVEDLFYNCPLRKNALKANSEEFAKIYEVVSRYAIHNYHCSFYLKRLNESGIDVKTSGALKRSPETEQALYDTITSIYGGLLKEKIDKVSIELDEKYKFEMNAFMANAKMFTFILFINERLVDCQPLKKSLQNLFGQYMPKNEYLFVYINLKLDPNNIDVNVHPTKHEVRFLYQDEIVNKIQAAFEQKFLNSTSTRTYYVQNLTIDSFVSGAEPKRVTETTEKKSSQSGSQQIVYPYQLTRVDSKEQKLETFLHQTSLEKSIRDIKENNKAMSQSRSQEESKTSSGLKSFLRSQTLSRTLNLSSVNELKEAIEKSTCKELLEIVQNMSFVGCLERELAVIQHQTSLYILNTQLLSQELFYQIAVFNFGNFGYFKLEQPISLYELSLMAFDDPESEWTPSDGPKEKLAKKCAKFINSKALMLDDYFSIKIKRVQKSEEEVDYYLEALPMLIEDLEPNLIDLPMFVIRLVSVVEWSDEKECFDSIAKELALFYSIKNDNQKTSTKETQTQTQSGDRKPKENWCIEHVLYRAFKNVLLPSKEIEKNARFKLVDLAALYKVFERC